MRSVTNRLLGPKTYPSLFIVSAHAHDLRARTWLKKMADLYQASSLKESTNTMMISSPLKPHTNGHTACGRPILNVFEPFMKGALRELYDRSIYERTFLSKAIENHAILNKPSQTH